MHKKSTGRDLAALFIHQIVVGNAQTQRGVEVLSQVLDNTSGDPEAETLLDRLRDLHYVGRDADVQLLINRFVTLYASGTRR